MGENEKLQFKEFQAEKMEVEEPEEVPIKK